MSHLLQTITHNKSKYLFIAVILIISSVYVFDRVKAQQQNTCFGQTATIVGTNQDDVIQGTEGNDVIVARGGRGHTIFGLGGDDIICSGNGDDEIHGGSGDDTIDGGKKNDTIFGETGNDFILGDKGSDILHGGTGFDELDGGSSEDTCINGDINNNCEFLQIENTPSVADAGPDQSVFVGDTVQLDGSSSSDVDGDPLIFLWNFQSKPAGSNATLSDPTAVQPTYDIDVFGTYILDLTVNDGIENSTPDSVTITTLNSAPVANAGPDQSVFVGDTVQLDGSGSSDVDGDTLTFSWSFVSRPQGSNATLSDPTAVQPTFDVDVFGTYVLELIVNDGTVDSAPDSVTITTLNSPPVANAGPDQAISVPTTVQLDGSGSTDVDGDLLTFNWSLTSIPQGSSAQLSDANIVNPTFNADIPGTYVAQLIVNDGTVDSDADTVTITTENIRPVVDAGFDQTVFVTDTVQLDGSGSSDADNDPLTFSWSFVSVPIGSTTTLQNPTSVNPTLIVDVFGDYVVQLIVNDGIAGSDPDTVLISTDNSRPVADAGLDQTVPSGSLVQLDGSGSFDVDNDPLTFDWDFISVPPNSSASLSDPSSSQPTFEVDRPGTYIPQLIVNDGTLNSLPDTVAITRENAAPILDPIGNQSVAIGSTLTNNLTATDADNDILSFSASPLPLPEGSSLNSTNGTFVFTPITGQEGDIVLTFTVSDGELSASETITITVTGALPGGNTTLVGRVVDAYDASIGVDTPIVGATVSLLNTAFSTTTDTSGNFTLDSIPGGEQILDVDASTANLAPDGSQYASFREALELIPDVTNNIDRPIFLPRIDSSSLTTVDPANTTVVTNPNLGVSLTIPPNTAKNPDGTDFTGDLSISEVPAGFAPAPLPEELEPGLLVTIQPVGVSFSTPVPITFPNTDNLSPGSEVDIWSLDPDTGEFTIVGIGQVSADGSVIETISGGIIAADWHAALPPASAGGPPLGEPDCNSCCTVTTGSNTALATGNLVEEHNLVSYRSLNQSSSLRFVYNSQLADPRPITTAETTILQRGAVPQTASISMSIAGVEQGTEVFTDTSGLSESADEDLIQSIQFDATSFPTGVYRYETKVSSNYNQSSVSSIQFGQVQVNNQINSPFGAGWTLDGLSKLHVQDDGSVLITEGDGASWLFKLGTVAFMDDFEGLVGPEWSNNSTDTTPNGGRNFLGMFGNETVSLTLTDLALHTDVLLSFDLFIVGSWDGNRTDFGPDTWDLSVFNGPDLLPTSFCNTNVTTQAYPDTFPGGSNPCRTEASENNTLGFVLSPQFGVIDSVYQVSLTFPHSASSLTLDFSALVSFPGDERWGLENVNVSLITPGQLMFQSPPGDFSTLVKNPDGSFTRTMKDGTQIHLNSQGLQTSVVDRNGNTTTYTYDANGLLTSITDPVGMVTTLAYTGGKLSSITDPANRTTTFQHDGAGNLTKITDPDTTSRMFSYDSNHHIISQTSKRGFVTTYQYNFAGRNTSAIRPDGSLWSVSPSSLVGLPNISGGIGTQSNPASVVRPEDVLATFTDGNGNTSTYETNEFGSITELIDALGRTMTTTRDEHNNIVQSIDPRGNVIDLTYDGNGNLLTSINQSIAATSTFTYTNNGFNQIKTITDPNGNTTVFDYDANGNPTSILDGQSNETMMSYDNRGLLISTIDAQNNTTNLEYDLGTGNLIGTTDPLLNETIFTLDAEGNVMTRTDAEGRTTQFVYDSINRIIRVIDSVLATTDYSYDSSGNLINTTDARSKTTNFEYDSLNRLISKIDPLGNAEFFAYDLNGNFISKIDRNGQTINFVYDAANQPINKILPGNLITTLTYDNAGNLITLHDPDSSITMTYDGANRLTSLSTTGSPNQPDVTISYSYDLNNNRLTMTNTLTGPTNYNYDSLNRLTSMTNPNGQTVNFTHDSLGRMTQKIFPNGVVTDFSYDAKNQLTSLVNQVGATSISDFNYMYDNIGNRLTMNTSRSSVIVNNNLTYSYDNLDRLIKATSPLPSQADEMFTYDTVGNRLFRNERTTNAVFDNANRLIEDQEFTYAYDTNGNLIQKTNKNNLEVTQYIYDVENRLIQIDKPGMTVSYRYDGLNRRIENNVNGVITRFVYDESNILLEFDGNNILIASYTHGSGIDEILAMARDGQNFFYHKDILGSITEITNSEGSVVQNYVYDSFGQIASQTGVINNPFTYTGREIDPENGLYYFRARHYDAAVGRFLQEDPVPGSITVPQSLNSYPYVLNNPLNFIDPFGLTPQCLGAALNSFKDCMTFGGIATNFSAGNYFAACGILGLAFGAPIVPCVAAVAKIAVVINVVTFTICYSDYLDDRNKCESKDGCLGPSLGPIPIPGPPSCGTCNSDLKR
ncbi:PKD domain-containing protein [Desulfobacterota bacterium AH_259_B03_O07]|nr:PKD domain-containing protein [Desulfobacterota bacterium AH_259_B03_O07]